jgi:hypothetical protein
MSEAGSEIAGWINGIPCRPAQGETDSPHEKPYQNWLNCLGKNYGKIDPRWAGQFLSICPDCEDAKQKNGCANDFGNEIWNAPSNSRGCAKYG